MLRTRQSYGVSINYSKIMRKTYKILEETTAKSLFYRTKLQLKRHLPNVSI